MSLAHRLLNRHAGKNKLEISLSETKSEWLEAQERSNYHE
jgi:hypothetical protein